MYKKILLITIFVTLFSGCNNYNKVNQLFQTQRAVSISQDYKDILNLVIKYKNKLDKRNPKHYNKDFKSAIFKQIELIEKNITLKDTNDNRLANYKQYLDLAFNKKGIKYRNDYLILGLYYMIYDAYSLEKIHKFTAFNYDNDKLTKLYKNLYILRWKIRTAKDINGNYLFLTWQNNWQIEYMNKKINDLNDIRKLNSIISKQENLMSHSNFSFEIILSMMINRVESTLRNIGTEPSDIAIDTITSLVFLI
ncbi:hypothetical protein CPU12_04635 [Malaciobacter molluscorum LMG 25693]|uniref:Lipoprotein n=1 Tax=Malaciobacter molluscorum LMG 25693 TaxID=870501 RepID=A0A2G1DJE3_9BACT|nr:hypothetical protein [Malaciobacter molluscorum]AXX91635.1 hypothetical protein AMOL_0634 [Malaciobacter molluscorum LMG 25693]PHO18570.1 hypothetical protein CPU12_04635 [Malaciobacter molluscorum LMG 25693]